MNAEDSDKLAGTWKLRQDASSPLDNASASGGRARSHSAIGRASGILSRWVGSTSTAQATGRFLRQQLWAWPIIAAVVFGGAGWWVRASVESAMHTQRAIDLNTMVDTSVTSLRAWMGEQRSNVALIADDEAIQRLTRDLLDLHKKGGDAPERQLLLSRAQADLRARLRPKLKVCGYTGFVLMSSDWIHLGSDQDLLVGKPLPHGYRREYFKEAFAGRTTVSKPYRSTQTRTDEDGVERAHLPTMFVVGPIRDEEGKIIAALGLRIRPEDQFTRILQVVRFGESGETFAFDEKGLLLSQSRFDERMKLIGLLADQPEARSILTIEVRDPGVDMVAGERPSVRRSEQPLTRMAADAVQGKNGVDPDGYRSYRGVMRVGAWRWLPEYDFGVATEVDVAEAFAPVVILRRAIWSLMALLALAAVGIFIAMLYMARQQRALQKATLAAKQLGQYALEDKLGAGGMGTVYKARHAMLRRPTAVKLLDVDKMSDAAVARFEREVQMTSTLTHPNTVAVFDYGRTPDGVFYYAMEYLDGMNLEDFIKRFGPVSEARMAFLLRQLCGSLAEAHALGLVHRDIKPANIFLTRRGGLHDFVKVLDFGLVKPIGGSEQANVTSPYAMMGTPYYMAPETVNHAEAVDMRADVYAVGAVAFFMLTGEPVFKGATVMEICMKHVNEPPEAPSQRSGKNITLELETLIMRCLAKHSSDRPADAGHVLRELDLCVLSETWTAADAATWWQQKQKSENDVTSMDPVGILTTPAPDSTAAYHDPPRGNL